MVVWLSFWVFVFFSFGCILSIASENHTANFIYTSKVFHKLVKYYAVTLCLSYSSKPRIWFGNNSKGTKVRLTEVNFKWNFHSLRTLKHMKRQARDFGKRSRGILECKQFWYFKYACVWILQRADLVLSSTCVYLVNWNRIHSCGFLEFIRSILSVSVLSKMLPPVFPNRQVLGCQGVVGWGTQNVKKNLTDSEKSAEDAAPGAVSQYKKTAAQTGLEFTWVETPFFKFLIKF